MLETYLAYFDILISRQSCHCTISVSYSPPRRLRAFGLVQIRGR